MENPIKTIVFFNPPINFIEFLSLFLGFFGGFLGSKKVKKSTFFKKNQKKPIPNEKKGFFYPPRKSHQKKGCGSPVLCIGTSTLRKNKTCWHFFFRPFSFTTFHFLGDFFEKGVKNPVFGPLGPPQKHGTKNSLFSKEKPGRFEWTFSPPFCLKRKINGLVSRNGGGFLKGKGNLSRTSIPFIPLTEKNWARQKLFDKTVRLF